MHARACWIGHLISEYLDLGTGIEYLSACLETRTANEDRDAVRAFSLGSGTVGALSGVGASSGPVIAGSGRGAGGLLAETCAASAALAIWKS